jgi:hypothetical protein
VNDDTHKEVQEEETTHYHKQHEEKDPPWMIGNMVVLIVL